MSSKKIYSPFVEYNIVEHCNLNCFQCDHGSSTMPLRFVKLENFWNDLVGLSKILRVKKLKIIGGEPLLHPQLLRFIIEARKIGISSKIAVITNGTLLHTMDINFWRLIDELQVTCYPGVKLKINLDELREKSEKHVFTLNIIKRDTFRYTLLNRRINDNVLVKQIYDKCELRTIHNCHTVRNGMYFMCSPAPFMADRLLKEGIIYKGQKDDGVPIHNNPKLKSELKNYLLRSNPLSACHYCLGTVGKNFPHVQISQVSTKTIMKLNNPLDLINNDLL